MSEIPGLPADIQNVMDLQEYVTDLRTKKGYVVDPLPKPPLHHRACDDVNGKFQWWIMIDDAGQTLGYFYTDKGVVL